MHAQITVLRYDAVAIAQHHCCPDGGRLVTLRGIHAASNPPLEKELAGAVFHFAGEAHKIVDLQQVGPLHFHVELPFVLAAHRKMPRSITLASTLLQRSSSLMLAPVREGCQVYL